MAQAREEVLRVVAHDLRNPLNVIVSSADMLVQERLDRTKVKELMAVVLRAGKQMNRLIADLLDSARLQAGRITLDLEDVPVKTILEQTAETFRPVAATSKIELVAVPPNDNVAVRADPLRVSQIIGNLMGNALKFTPEHGIVTLRATPNGHSVAFHITDTGPGIPANDIEHLFDNFWQARNDHRGIGLGLPIAKGMVEAHGGMIWCDTQPGKGATFSFTLPKAVD
jgi:signal transduction histidine kinase